MVASGMAVLATYVAGSMLYVYKFRGQARYECVSQYLRKSWPLFAPLNCLLYLFTQKRGRRPILDVREFPELDLLREHWQTFRDEAQALHRQRCFDATTRKGAASSYDIGFRTFFKYGWSKFYLNWYGYTHASAEKLCPKSAALLKQVPSLNGAMFALLPAGSELTCHADPMACSMRYHLGLSTPNADSCFINIDGKPYSWRDGEVLMFDETYMHYARNDSTQDRLILMCDIDRPTWGPGRVVNALYKLIPGATVVPNLKGDRCGLGNRIYATLAPAFARSKQLKQTNRPMYLALKYSVNGLLMLLVLGLIAGLLQLSRQLVMMAG